MLKKTIAVLIIFVFIFVSYSPIIHSSNLNKIESKIVLNTNEIYLIKDVPIIGQEGCTCEIASLTMLLNYYGYNFTNHEVYYLLGCGFSLSYNKMNYLKPFTSEVLSFKPSFFEYLGLILNLSFQPFYANNNLSDELLWNTIWQSIKTNISLNQPVLIAINGVITGFYYNGFKLPASYWKKIPFHISHIVTIVGYNESNNSICFNDPVYSLFKLDELGLYNWINIDIFKEAFFSYHIPCPLTYRIKSFTKPILLDYNRSDIIEIGLNRNIELLKGDSKQYYADVDIPDFEYIRNTSYGINATIELQKLFNCELQIKIKTLDHYKQMGKLGVINNLLYILHYIIKNRIDIDLSYVFNSIYPNYRNIYKNIAEDKLLASKILCNYSYISPEYKRISYLLQNESELWFLLAKYNRFLLNKGMLTSIPCAFYIFDKMGSVIEEIIQIEKYIII